MRKNVGLPTNCEHDVNTLERHVKKNESICLGIAASKWSTKHFIPHSRALILSNNADTRVICPPNSESRVHSRDAHFRFMSPAPGPNLCCVGLLRDLKSAAGLRDYGNDHQPPIFTRYLMLFGLDAGPTIALVVRCWVRDVLLEKF